MFSSEIKETIYIAIGCMLAAAVLGLIAFAMNIRGDLAVVNNNQLANQRNMTSYTTLSRYNNEGKTDEQHLIYTDDVIVCIREFFDSDIEVIVDNFVGVGGRYYTYEIRKAGGLNATKFKIDELMKATRGQAYTSYLVFGEYNREDYNYLLNKNPTEYRGNLNYSEVTAIVIKKK